MKAMLQVLMLFKLMQTAIFALQLRYRSFQ